MKIIKFLGALALTSAFIFFLNRPIRLEEKSIPPLGQFFNPFSGFWANAESPIPGKPKSLELPALKGKGEILFDERMVPHIFAENQEDAMFLQGYVTASMRLWQMDISARAAGGRLAEIAGARALPKDKLQRRRGMLWAAERTLENWKKTPEAFGLIQAYSDGVNAYIRQLKPRDYPIEFKLLGYAPEQWSPLKTTLFYKSMEETLSIQENDIESSNALSLFGRDVFDYLFPEWNPAQAPVIPAGTNYDFKKTDSAAPDTANQQLGLFHHDIWEKDFSNVGSNNWAIAGSKSKTGNPILCNDPHLKLTLPSIWFENQIVTPEANTYGVSFPGVPGVIIGFNEFAAWGFTNGSHDVLDWYQIKWVDATKQSYFLDGKPTPVEVKMESFKVKGQKEPVLDTVKYTVWGPIVYESGNDPHQDLAMRWIAHDTGDDFIWRTFWTLDAAKSFEDYNHATDYFGHPVQNLIFADKAGKIALKVTGLLPLREKEKGRFVLDGSLQANAWAGYVPREQMPQMKNPGRGFVFSANQHSTDTTYPHYYTGNFEDFRSRAIFRKLTEMDSITVEDFMKMQNSNFSIAASELLPLLLQHLDTTRLNSVQMGLAKVLRDWDFNYDAPKTEPVIYAEWMNGFYREMWDEFNGVADSLPLLRPEIWRTIALLKSDPTTVFFDKKSTPERESPADIVTQSFIAACDSLKTKLLDPTYSWAKHKGTEISHLGQIAPFSRKDIQVGGVGQAINAMSKTNGPSWRMIVELGKDSVNGWGVYPGGQSGNPGSKFYDSQIDEWADGKYFELFFMKTRDDRTKNILYAWTFNKK